ncbi:polyprenyl synthetase family protein [Chitinophaga nivalis]|uniref:Polyprenyl synthetase family protein n=1 Tax=Chitinophaga nivalis TaxID=2991709 RepID=A0ABT3IJE5_9BACT|nr:polyprenyl synthetase family protein [Chitinophaga nivalis]MCW3466241.1 polyprenyl synthetase family protein [Chitinophaga nivalis]MCW3484068.1 polyprenyl synthetase family protein [Chitinophaga nivalis]
MFSLKEILVTFQQRIEELTFPVGPVHLYDSIRYFLEAGGKRVRPALCLLGNQLFDDIQEDAFQAGIAIELFHNYSLVHDDIMDSAPLRRGRPTVHMKYNLSVALLAGDVLLINAFSYIHQVQHIRQNAVRVLFSNTTIQVCDGQQMDLNLADSVLTRVSYADYLEMITMKTAVLLAAGLQIGAMIGGANKKSQELLYTFGKYLGIAFQLQDDYLDTFGDPALTGKQAGGDIMENKKTALLVKAMEMGSPVQQRSLEQTIGNNDADKVSRTTQLFQDTGADRWLLAEIAHYTALASDCLTTIDVPDYRKAPLIELIDMLLVRKY